jgi:hypothetical protein
VAALALVVAVGALVGRAAWRAREERKPKPLDGVLSVRSAPPGARVLVDGREVPGRTPLFARHLHYGAQVAVEVRLAGYRPWRGTGKVHEKYGDGMLLVNLQREGAASAPASAPATAPAP